MQITMSKKCFVFCVFCFDNQLNSPCDSPQNKCSLGNTIYTSIHTYIYAYLIKKIITMAKRISPSRNLRLEMFEY